MRTIFLIAIIAMTACSNGHDKEPEQVSPVPQPDNVGVKRTDTDPIVSAPSKPSEPAKSGEPSKPKVYGNARFRNVTIEKLGANKFKVNGQGQIFEASFNWVIEDGHNELKTGYTTTDAGAPEWGNFDMTVTVPGIRENSVPHIILFEASAKDGRRTHELAIPLP